MAKKQISAKIFTGVSIATPKHDDMLLLFGGDSSHLNKLIHQVAKKELAKKITTIKEEVWKTELNKKKTLIRKEYCHEDYKHDIIYNAEYRGGEETVLPKDKTRLIALPVSVPKYDIEITEWSPEKPILNKGYYIGSVDLFVEGNIKFNCDLKSDGWLWKNYSTNTLRFKIIIEFKPLIKSYSETIRQVNVYLKYLDESIPFVVTYSNISKFKEIFEKVEIGLMQLKGSP